MASWALANTTFPFHISRLIPKPTLLARHTRLLPHVASKAFASALSVSVDIDPSDMTPSMEEMLKQPSRTFGWDRSIFEEATEEYDHSEVLEPNGAQRKPCDVLLQLIDANDFTTATRVKEELEKLGVTIQPDTRYMAAAVNALTSSTDARDWLPHFNAWTALVPTPELFHQPTFFQSNSFTKLPGWKAATLRHATIAASMGYSSSIAPRIVPWALKSVTIAASRGFMQTLSEADLAYRERANSIHATGENRRHFKSWYALAIRTRCMENDTRSACTLLRDALAREYNVPLFTMQFLLHKLRDKHDRKNASWVAKRYWALKERGVASPEDLTVTGKAALADLVRKILADGHIPTRSRLRSFIHLCVSSGDTELFHDILDQFHTHKSYERAIRQWANAEMSYYFDQGMELAALCVFRHYFRTAGIPKAVESMLDELKYDTLPEYLRSRSAPHSNLVWPDAKVTIHLWQLLLKAVPQHQMKYMYLEFESLYDGHALLKHSGRSVSPAELKQARSLLAKGRIPPPSAPLPFGLDHFRQFLHAISRFNDPLLLVSVIQKMRALGWHPRKGDLSAITGCFSRGGSPERLIPLLEELRSDYKMQPASNTDPDPVDDADLSVRVPSGMYRKAVRSMMGVNRYADAAKIARHLRNNVGYEFGMNQKTDRTLGILYTKLKQQSREVAPTTVSPPTTPPAADTHVQTVS